MTAQATGALLFYPLAILKFIQAIEFNPVFREFPPSVRGLLVEMATRLDQNDPARPFWFKRRTVAESRGLCRRTVERGLARLEKAGYISRLPQTCNDEGWYCCALIRPSAKLLAAIAPQDPPSAPASHPGDISPPAHISDYNLKKQPEAGGFFSEFKEDESPAKPPLPRPGLFQGDAALRRLLLLGLERPAVYALMNLCRKSGQRLSDVVNCLGDRLNGVDSPRGLFAYLRRCIQSGQDFSGRWRGLEEKTQKNALADEQKRAFEEFRRSAGGLRFRAEADGRIFMADAGGWACDEASGGCLPLFSLFEAVRAGKVKPVGRIC